MEGRDFLSNNYQPREFVVAARDRCDYTIDHIRAIVTKRFKYLENCLTDVRICNRVTKIPGRYPKIFAG